MGTFFDRAILVLPRGCGYGMAAGLLTTVAAGATSTVIEEGSAVGRAVIGMISAMFYVGVPVLVAGFSIGFTATLLGLLLRDLVRRTRLSDAQARWVSATLPALGAGWASSAFIAALGTAGGVTAALSIVIVVLSIPVGLRLLRRFPAPADVRP